MNKKEYMKMTLGGASIFLLLTQIPLFLFLLLIYPLVSAADPSSSGQVVAWTDISKSQFIDMVFNQNFIPFVLMLIAGIVFFIILKSESIANNEKIIGSSLLIGGSFSVIFLIGYTPSSLSLYSSISSVIQSYNSGVASGLAFGDIMNELKLLIILSCVFIVALALAIVLIIIGLSKLTGSKKDEEYVSAFDDVEDASDWVVSAAEENDNSEWQVSEAESADSADIADSASADAGDPETAEAAEKTSEEVSEEVLGEAAEKTDEK